MKVDDDFIYDIGPIIAAKKVEGKEKYIEEKIFKLQKILINIRKGKIYDKTKAMSIEELIEKWRSYLEN
jgi:hypothetical protein